MNKKFCQNCGKPVPVGAKFCNYCGAKVGADQPTMDPDTANSGNETEQPVHQTTVASEPNVGASDRSHPHLEKINWLIALKIYWWPILGWVLALAVLIWASVLRSESQGSTSLMIHEYYWVLPGVIAFFGVIKALLPAENKQQSAWIMGIASLSLFVTMPMMKTYTYHSITNATRTASSVEGVVLDDYISKSTVQDFTANAKKIQTAIDDDDTTAIDNAIQAASGGNQFTYLANLTDGHLQRTPSTDDYETALGEDVEFFSTQQTNDSPLYEVTSYSNYKETHFTHPLLKVIGVPKSGWQN